MYKTLDEVRTAVMNSGDVLTLEMRELRDAYGVDRLGPIVRANITKALSGLGLGHYPQDLPEYQHQLVRLYRLGTQIADLIDAVLTPDPAHDQELRDAISGDKATLDKIRELVAG